MPRPCFVLCTPYSPPLLIQRSSATYFAYLSSVSYVVNLLGPALASATMDKHIWAPFYIGISLLCLAALVAYMLPARFKASQRSDSAFDASSHGEALLSSPILKAQASDPSVLTALITRLCTLRAIVTSHPRNFTLLLISFFLTSLASSDTKLLAQYISKRYDWTFAAAGYLLSGKAVVNFTLLTVVIPVVLRSGLARAIGRTAGETSPDKMSLRFASICLMVSVAGAFLIGLAAKVWLLVPSLLIYAFGSALPVFTLSLLKSPSISPPLDHLPADSKSVETHIFSIVMLVKTLGSLVGAPLMAVMWMQGIALGGMALGMPYFLSAASYVAATMVFRGIRVG